MPNSAHAERVVASYEVPASGEAHPIAGTQLVGSHHPVYSGSPAQPGRPPAPAPSFVQRPLGTRHDLETGLPDGDVKKIVEGVDHKQDERAGKSKPWAHAYGRRDIKSVVFQPKALRAPTFWRDIFVEFLTTMLFIIFVLSSIVFTNFKFAGGVGLVGIAFAFGVTILVLVYSSAGISGGHLNPAVTFAMFLAGRIDILKGAGYVIAQMVGAIVGAAIVAGMNEPLWHQALGGCNYVQSGFSVGAAFGAEVIGTFVLVYTVFAATDPKRSVLEDSPHLVALGPLAIGLAIFVVHIAFIPVDGVSINPARSFGPAVVLNNSHVWKDMWIFWVGPLLGAACAMLVYEYIIRGSDAKSMQREKQ